MIWITTGLIATSGGHLSTKLVEHSHYYKTFSNILQVRVVRGEFLLATKLVAGRTYKHDLTDIVEIMIKEEREGYHYMSK